jgi:glycosyltransferase involved in cell wall biosynthesis
MTNQNSAMSPLVSVMLPVYLQNKFLKPAVESILNQTMSNFELFIVANNCSDDLWESLKEFKDPRIKLYRTPIGQITYNLNLAAHHSNAKFLARMDADDIAEPNRLEAQLKYFEKNPNLDVLGCSFLVINENGEVLSETTAIQSNKNIRKSLAFRNPFCHPTMMIKKSTFFRSNGYLGGFYSEDFSLWLRMSRDNKIVFENTKEMLLKYRIHTEQTRGHRLAYSEIAGLLWTEFLYRPSFILFLGWMINSLKIFKSRKA